MNMNDVVLNSSDAANINYVKARCAIEENAKSRLERRTAKLVVIEHLGGTIKHPTAIELRKGATKQVVFNDGTKARF